MIKIRKTLWVLLKFLIVLLIPLGLLDDANARFDEIRSVDFSNFTYDVGDTYCAKLLGKKVVKVKNGIFGDPSDIFFAIADDSIVYGDLTGDGRDEAVVLTSCGGMHSTEQPLIFTMQNGRATLLLRLEEGGRAMGGILYGHLCQGCSYGLRIQKGLLTVKRMWGKAACCPEYIEKKIYRWNGRNLVQVGKTHRRQFISKYSR